MVCWNRLYVFVGVAWPVMSMEGPMEDEAGDDEEGWIELPGAHNPLGEVYVMGVEVHLVKGAYMR